MPIVDGFNGGQGLAWSPWLTTQLHNCVQSQDLTVYLLLGQLVAFLSYLETTGSCQGTKSPGSQLNQSPLYCCKVPDSRVSQTPLSWCKVYCLQPIQTPLTQCKVPCFQLIQTPLLVSFLVAQSDRGYGV